MAPLWRRSGTVWRGSGEITFYYTLCGSSWLMRCVISQSLQLQWQWCRVLIPSLFHWVIDTRSERRLPRSHSGGCGEQNEDHADVPLSWWSSLKALHEICSSLSHHPKPAGCMLGQQGMSGWMGGWTKTNWQIKLDRLWYTMARWIDGWIDNVGEYK